MLYIRNSRNHTKHLAGLALAIVGLTSYLILPHYSSSTQAALAKTAEVNQSSLTEQRVTAATPTTAGVFHSPLMPTKVDQALRARVSATYGKLPLSFEANQGQSDRRVKFLSRGSGYDLFFTPTEVALALSRHAKHSNQDYSDPRKLIEASDERTNSPTVLRMKMVGANPHPLVTGLEEQPGKVNYFIGNNPAKWHTDVRTYTKVQYKSIYPGVDLIYYGNQRQLEYDLVVSPGADPNTITVNLDGAEKIEIDAAGDLVLRTAGGEIRQPKPYIYQEVAGKKQEIAGSYVFRNKDHFGFKIGTYDSTKPLIIDPVLSYATFLGGSGRDLAFDIAADASGNTYVTGTTSSANFPLTPDAAQKTPGGGFGDAFITKLNPTGSALIYSTFLGGGGNEFGAQIVVDSTGNAYVSGIGPATDFPVTPGAYRTSGEPRSFLTKLNASGSALIYSTYLPFPSSGSALAIDVNGNAYLAGVEPAFSGNRSFATPGAFQTTPQGSDDVFIAKLNSSGSALIYATYLGGAGGDFANAIVVDAQENVYVTGNTYANNTATANFPTTPGAYRTRHSAVSGAFTHAAWDAFVTKLNPTGSALVYSTLFGGAGGSAPGDEANFGTGIAVDAAGNAYVTGSTQTTNFPTTPGAYQTTSPGFYGKFVTKFNPSGSALIYSTYVGSSGVNGNTSTPAIALDTSGQVYIAHSEIVSKLNAAGSALLYSQTVSGAGISSLAIDSAGNAYVAGSVSDFTRFFTTADAVQVSPGGGVSDAFVAKISETPASTALQYYPLPRPIRLLDTRAGEPACDTPGVPLTGSTVRTEVARLTCNGITIPANAQAVVGNATAVNMTPGAGTGYVTLYPSNASRPTVSNLNYTPGQVVANAFTVGLGSDGTFNIFALTTLDFIVDITGYYAPPRQGGLFYHPLPSPVRLLDTRPGEPACDRPGVALTGGVSRSEVARGSCAGAFIPSNAQAIVGNATVVNDSGSGSGYVTLYPSGTARPTVSNLNYTAGQVVPNSFTVGLRSSDGAFDIYALTTTHLIVDITGYYSDQQFDVNGQGLLFNPLSTPIRILDTRAGEPACNTASSRTPFSNGETRIQAAHLTCGITIPNTAQAVVGNATVVNNTAGAGTGFVTLYPSGASRPTVSNLNYVPGQVVPNSFVVGLGSDGKFNIFALTNLNFIVDLTGYFAP